MASKKIMFVCNNTSTCEQSRSKQNHIVRGQTSIDLGLKKGTKSLPIPYFEEHKKAKNAYLPYFEEHKKLR